MVQQIIIGIMFLGATGFIGRAIYQSVQAKHACATGCSKCGAVDFEKIEKQIRDSVNLRQKENSRLTSH